MSLTHVVTCDYIAAMKTKSLKQTTKQPVTSGDVLNDAITMADLGITFPVRIAKAKLSALLELVATGQEVVITSDGEPKARLVGIKQRERGKVFTGMGDFLLKQPIHHGMSADEAVREDRDARGW